MAQYAIKITIISSFSGQPLPNATVEVWDKDLFKDDAHASEITHTTGEAVLYFDDSPFGDEKAPDLYFKVFYEGEPVYDGKKEKEIFSKMKAGQHAITIKVKAGNSEEGEAVSRWEVTGVVTGPDNRPLTGWEVEVLQKKLREETSLGKGISDEAGQYRVVYDLGKESTRRPDLQIRVKGDKGKELFRSETFFAATEKLQRDIRIEDPYPGLSEWEQNLRRLGEAAGKDFKLTDLKQDDVEFLSGKTGIPKEVISRTAISFLLNNESGIAADLWYGVLSFSLGRSDDDASLAQQYAYILRSVYKLDERNLRNALGRAEARNIIPKQQEGYIDTFLAAFDLFASRQMSEAPEGDPLRFFSEALDIGGLTDQGKREKFVGLYRKEGRFSKALDEALRNDNAFSDKEIDELATTFRLSEIVVNDMKATRAIRSEFGVSAPKDLPKLAQQTQSKWTAFAKKHLPGGPLNLTANLPPELNDGQNALHEAYGAFLFQRFQSEFPTSAFLGRLQTAAISSGDLSIDKSRELISLLEKNPLKELHRTPIDALIGEDKRLKDDKEFRLELGAVQRVFKLAPDFEAANTLLKDGIHSARQVYRMGESEFVSKYKDKDGFDPVIARRTWNRSSQTHAAAVTLVTEMKAVGHAGAVAALSSGTEAVQNFPNYESLFNVGDICDCEHCRSAYSPAAYYADLLMFLKDRRGIHGDSLTDLLFTRRPDLGFIELNCENANVTLPYIDVVNEVLEEAVSFGTNDLELTGLMIISADYDTAIAEIAAAFAVQGIELTGDIHLGDIPSTTSYVVHTDAITYLLALKSTPNYFAKVLHNTKGSSDELRANPQYVNSVAYDILKAAKYPMSLPFDLFGDEIRAALNKVKLDRWEIMQVFHGTTSPNFATGGQIAAEYFGIAVDTNELLDEMRIIIVPDVANQHEYWGEGSASDMLDKMKNVKAFLTETGIEYNDLLRLLDLKTINPNGDLKIDNLDATCDLAQKEITNLDAEAFDRFNRFLRMWRKTEWEMWELDLLIRAPAVGAGRLDEAFLINAMHFHQLQQNLGSKATVERVLTFFGDINAETRFTELHGPREDGLYQELFLNENYVFPLDEAFLVAAVDVTTPTEKLSDHLPPLLSGLGIKEADFEFFYSLKNPSGDAYLSDELTLGNITFLHWNSWLADTLKVSPEDWIKVHKIHNQDQPAFANPKEAMDFVEWVQHLLEAELSIDEAYYALSADPEADSAVEEADAARFLLTLRQSLQAIVAEYDSGQYEFLASPTETDVSTMSDLVGELLLKLARDETEVTAFNNIFTNIYVSEAVIEEIPDGTIFPEQISDVIRITWIDETKTLRFTGWMTDTEKNTLLTDTLLSEFTVFSEYLAAIENLYWQPRLEIKFFSPFFEADLAYLPEAVDFSTQLPEDLTRHITYSTETHSLRSTKILTPEDKKALESLSAGAKYRTAVDQLFLQPRTGTFPTEVIWLEEPDLAMPLDEMNLPANLATAISKALEYLKVYFGDLETVNQLSEEFGLNVELINEIVTTAKLTPPKSILDHLTEDFASTDTAVDYAGHKITIDTYFWLYRLTSLIGNWKISLPGLNWLVQQQANAQTLEIMSLPIDPGDPIASGEHYVRTNRLIDFRNRTNGDSLETLELLGNTIDGTYSNAAQFAAGVELMTDGDWTAENVEDFVNEVDLVYPGDYFLAENLERLERGMYLLDKLDWNVETILTFTDPNVAKDDSGVLKGLMRVKYGRDDWFELSTEIQDVLRERQRDALVAWLLSQPAPSLTPSGKWENSNDVYAYFLLDVEMSSCFLTSRLVQAHGSVQLYVQRCFMGLEPEVVVDTGGDDGDSAWHWWTWMNKYRVWEANRKVFLYPENWIEPELRIDKSPFFKDLENELLQNEINELTAEDAFIHYLEKLNKVARLEIAGYFQEDDGDNTILHVFGRTSEGEPHEYYYRTYDYRFWSPWQKVEADITGDYLAPAVINKRVFILWPEFTEVSDGSKNDGASDGELAWKHLRLQIALSEFRNGEWIPKKISKDFIQTQESYQGEILKREYRIWAVDQENIEGPFGIRVSGHSVDIGENKIAPLFGEFALFGCEGVPVKEDLRGEYLRLVQPDDASDQYMKHLELRREEPDDFLPDDLAFKHNEFPVGSYFPWATWPPVLVKTPGTFKISMPWHLSFLDRLMQDLAVHTRLVDNLKVPIGGWMPYFYADATRTFFVRTLFDFGPPGAKTRVYYPEGKGAFKGASEFIEGAVSKALDPFDPSALTPAQRLALELYLGWYFYLTPPFTDKKVKDLVIRWIMQFFNYLLGMLSMTFHHFRKHHFQTFYHPSVCDFSKLVYNPLQGIPGLMSRETQLKTTDFNFFNTYLPTPLTLSGADREFHPTEDVDFAPDGSYSPYNWELFFHAPLMIANNLSTNQRFEEAMQWYHYIFNPIGVEGLLPDGSQADAPQKYWITKPFFLNSDEDYYTQRIDSILRIIAGDTTVDFFTAQLQSELEAQVLDWRNNPFEPHRIAQYRTVAYQKAVFMKYLDNLIAWGDFLFRQDSMESINEATQLYILAAELLGPRPQKIPPAAKVPVETFNELEEDFDAFSNALIQVENLVPVMSGNASGGPAAPIPMLYFCIPQNEILLEYWDTVADRLFKIRNCMNIDGVVRQLSLFEPPIDPAALVKAVAGGLSLGAVLANLNSPLPYYRFEVMLGQANQLCGDLKALAGNLLSVLEKQDAEELSQLRQSQEIRVQEAVKEVSELRIKEAEENLEALKLSRPVVEARRDFYRDVQKINAQEDLQLSKMSESMILAGISQGTNLAASIAALIPNFDVGVSGIAASPVAKVKFGGDNLGQATKIAADIFSLLSSIASNKAAMAGINAGHDRRWDDWKLQEDIANRELDQIDQQIKASEQTITIAEKELANQELRIEQAQEVEDFMQSKYTNKELYQWMVSQVSQTYFQSYQLAYDLAKRAERCYRFELGIQDSSFIQFGYWDSLKKGLMAGEKLQYDLRRLESAYRDDDRREFELTKHVSLSRLNPVALMQLRETGRCFFSFPEEIFDLDYPGHYFRRIKSVSISLPCVAGPYTTVSSTLRLLSNHVRSKTSIADAYVHNNEDGIWTDDTRFIQQNIPIKAIATSNAQNDSGMFELNFRDERYLPFEAAGVISDWSLELFNDFNGAEGDFGRPLRQFDYNTITDVIVHVRYTAREDAGTFKDEAIKHLRYYYGADNTTPSARILNLKHEFPNEWHKFLYPDPGELINTLNFSLTRDHFPYIDSAHTLKVNSIELIARCTDDQPYTAHFSPPLDELPVEADDIELVQRADFGNLHHGSKDTSGESIELDFAGSQDWSLQLKHSGPDLIAPDEVTDLILIVGYEWE